MRRGAGSGAVGEEPVGGLVVEVGADVDEDGEVILVIF